MGSPTQPSVSAPLTETGTTPLRRRVLFSAAVWTGLAIVLMSVLFWAGVWQTSLLIDGSRYFFLDDDQMISMRYARNLAEGRGLVWNAGERVEGYSNFGWVLIMAAVHWLGSPDRLASLWMKAINWVLCCAVLIQTARLVRRLAPVQSCAVPFALGTLAVCLDLLFWGVNGFETTLVTALAVSSIVAIIDDVQRGRLALRTCLTLGMIPLVRADAHLLAAGLGAIAIFLIPSRRTSILLAIGAALPFSHEVFRLAYYGRWLPNTYYLKVDGLDPAYVRAFPYLKGFVQDYSVVLLLAGATLLTRTSGRWLLLPVGGALLHVALVGADIFQFHRFLAPVLPMLVALACATAIRVTTNRLASMLLMASMLLSTVFQVGIHGRMGLALVPSPNGAPRQGVVTGWMINRYTDDSAVIAVMPAGNIPYFSRRPAIDLLGKSDAHVARLPARAGAPIGHNKFDIPYSLGRGPDLVVSFWPASHTTAIDELIHEGRVDPARDYGGALLTDPTFRQRYAPHVVPERYLLSHNAIYVRDTSPERERLHEWKAPQLH